MQEGDYVSAAALLSRGADYAASNRSEFTKILFLLSKGMVSCVAVASKSCCRRLCVASNKLLVVKLS